MHPLVAPTPAAPPPRRRALLLGCGGDSLRGVHGSLAALAAELTARRFTTAVCGPAATADELLVALATFTRATRAGDTVVVVYVGHAPHGPAGPAHLHIAVDPATRLDLGLALRHLAARADDVTAVLDCCHAPAPATPDEGWHQRLRAALGDAAVRADLGDVRLLGSTADAHDFAATADPPIGAFSRALTGVLAGTRAVALAWPELAAAAHARVGAVRRDDDPARGYPCTSVATGTELPAGRQHGVRVGDQFAVIAADGTTLRVAAVAAVTATTARLACAPVPPGARAVCISRCS